MYALLKSVAQFVLLACVVMHCPVGAGAQDFDNLSHLAAYDRLLVQYADSNNLDVVAVCLRKGANPNAATADSVTSLMYAVQNNNYYMVSLLLGYGAKPNIRPFNGISALHTATIMGNDSIAALLLGSGASINAQDETGLTPLHYSVWNGFPYLTQVLIDYGGAIDTTDRYGNTPLMLAIYNGTNGCAKILLDNGANPNRADNAGVSPLMVAAQFDDTLQIRYLVGFGADVLQKNRHERDALSYAIRRGSTNAVRAIAGYRKFNSNLEKSYYQQATEAQNKEIQGIISDYGLKSRLKATLNGVSMGFDLIAGQHSFLWGFNVGVTEGISNISFNLRYLSSPKYITIFEIRDMQMYQFREKRRVLGVGFARKQEFVKFDWQNEFGAYYGFGTDIIFRNYQGTNIDPKTRLHLSARTGFYYCYGSIELQAGWDYSSLSTFDASPHRFAISFILNLPATSGSFHAKTISHVQH